MDLPRDLIDLLAAFVQEEVDFVLVGGHAVAFHAVPRGTKDLDLLIASTPQNLDRAAAALARFGAPRNVVEATREMKEDDIVYLVPLQVLEITTGRASVAMDMVSRFADKAPRSVHMVVAGMDMVRATAFS